MDTTTTDWSSLPDHLLASIAEQLPKRIDTTLCFRAVCNSFRSSIPPPPKPLSPHADFKISLPSYLGRHGHLVLAEFTFYAIEPLPNRPNPHQITTTWVIKSEELNSGKVRLEDPLSRRCLGNLSNEVPESLNLLDYQVKEVGKAYRLEQVYQGKSINRSEPVVFGKAVMSCHDENDDGFAVMMERGGGIDMWRNLDKKWATIDLSIDDLLDGFDDIVYHNEKFFAVMAFGDTVTVDRKSLTVSKFAGPRPPQRPPRGSLCSYLIKSSQDLFWIMKFRHWLDQPIEFTVYKLDKEKCEWVEVMDGLEDSVFFVGDDGSFSLSAKEFPGCKGNCVYFQHGPFKGTKDDLIFDLKDGTVGGLSAFPGYSNIFWPRPTWVE